MTETIPDAAVLKNALLLACHAPSVYNSQPWRWMAQGGILDLFVDPRRIAPRSDPSGREAIISCGCVLDHLHIAMAAAGWDAHVDRFPKPNNLDHLATIDYSAAMLDVISDDDRPRLAEASQLSESLRRDDATFHAELRWWTSPSA